jgi:Protein involved in biosynthesis of mitomycin antibiotics/polyketide fumonisin
MTEGFSKTTKFLPAPELSKIETILRKFHAGWLIKNETAFKNGAINSAYITNGEFISAEERLELLKLVSSEKVITQARSSLGNDVRFLNTQIFFNPLNPSQNNYWHRDIQYTGQSEEQQRNIIQAKQTQVLHLRLALDDENGLEFIPGTHFKWDDEEQLNTRLKRNGRTPSDNLPNSKAVPLRKGDLLAFDANIIHRGLYGKNRFAFDMLFCQQIPDILKYRSADTLPKNEELKNLECPEIFA